MSRTTLGGLLDARRSSPSLMGRCLGPAEPQSSFSVGRRGRQADGGHLEAGGRRALDGHRGRRNGRRAFFGGDAARLVVVLPVLVLAEGAAVARRVAPAAGLVGLATAVPAVLQHAHKLYSHFFPLVASFKIRNQIYLYSALKCWRDFKSLVNLRNYR